MGDVEEMKLEKFVEEEFFFNSFFDPLQDFLDSSDEISIDSLKQVLTITSPKC